MTRTGNHHEFLMELLGNKTSIRILSYLIDNTTPLTRHALAKEIDAGIGPVYEQVLRFRALGVVLEKGGKMFLNPAFPFIEELKELFQRVSMYLQDLEGVLDRIDALLGDGYYLTGYLAARQHGTAIDYDKDSILVAYIEKGSEGETTRLLPALSRATPIDMAWFHVKHIPKEIIRRRIYGSDIWIASLERGILDSLVQQDFPTSAILTLLLQNLLDRNINKERFKTIAEYLGLWEKVCLLIQAFNKGTGRVLLPLTREDQRLAEKTRAPALLASAKSALNSVLGG